MEMPISSKLTSKYQATIPEKIRNVLGVKAGDSVAFEIIDNRQVMLRKIDPIDLEFARALEGAMSEWLSEHDEEAYGDL